MPEKTLEQLQKENAALTAENAKLKADKDQAQTVIKDLKDQVKTAESGQAVQTVKADGKTYQVLSEGFRFKGKDITLADLKKDTELVKTLVDAGSGFLVLVEKPGK